MFNSPLQYGFMRTIRFCQRHLQRRHFAALKHAKALARRPEKLVHYKCKGIEYESRALAFPGLWRMGLRTLTLNERSRRKVWFVLVLRAQDYAQETPLPAVSELGAIPESLQPLARASQTQGPAPLCSLLGVPEVELLHSAEHGISPQSVLAKGQGVPRVIRRIGHNLPNVRQTVGGAKVLLAELAAGLDTVPQFALDIRGWGGSAKLVVLDASPQSDAGGADALALAMALRCPVWCFSAQRESQNMPCDIGPRSCFRRFSVRLRGLRACSCSAALLRSHLGTQP